MMISPKYIPPEVSILHYSLTGLLSPEDILAVDPETKLVALLANGSSLPRLLQVQLLSANELNVFLPLLESFPYYCPYEILLASHQGSPTDRAIAKWRKRLEEALEEGVWDQEMRPVRNILSRLRIKTRNLGIDVKSIIGTGYMLAPQH